MVPAGQILRYLPLIFPRVDRVVVALRCALFADGGPDEAHHDEEAGEHGDKAN